MKKWYIAALILLLSVGGLTFYLLQKPEVTNTASGAEARAVFSDHTWRMNFTEEMRGETINEETVFVEDQEGDKVPVSLELLNDGFTLAVAPPEEGYQNGAIYTLHLSEEIRSSLGLKLKDKQAVEFKIVTDLPKFANEQELRDHFSALLEDGRALNYGGEIAVEESASEDSAASADSASGGAGGDFSTTNNQVEGVEEADIVQTDGEYIYVLKQNGEIRIEEILDDASTETVQTITLGDGNFYGSSLYLNGDTLIAIGDFWHNKPGQQLSTTTAKIYDVTDPASPALTREFSSEGYLASSRMVDDVLYLVTNHYPDVWAMQEDTDAEVRLQPFIKDTAVSDEFFTQPVDQIQKIPESESTEYATISAVPINEPDTEASVHSYLGSSGQIYMSKDNLYIASMQYTFFPATTSMPAGGSAGETEIYRFAIDGLNIQFAAQGKVPGRILNQFSMDEYNGYFRVATTTGDMWSEEQPSVNDLYILNEGMTMSGSVEDLAPGERIYSARFMGDKAYIVTFRETDPLYVIDTSDPTAPEVLGELKIPGFSTYLHPLDENHLIGFGVETLLEETKPGEAPIVRQEGMKISLFDITDFNNPLEKDVEVIGGPGTHSPVQYDHKALFRHEERGLYGFPIMLYEGENDNGLEFEGQGALMYRITTDGIEPAAEYMDEKDPNQLYEEYESMVQRMIYVEDHLYLVKYNGIDHYPLP
ncbi:beta-propeller domain-containing protein [Jeotgalibacillus sp. JSM ZJ347]|uniref:beta-propeller domain-containing protein n=1 Tax=Jeotgalibacillus sp. JSM ZJ347 TaxID=3342117 RepID=UPI0035A8FF8F